MLNENGELLLEDKDVADKFTEILSSLLNHQIYINGINGKGKLVIWV